MRPTLLIDLDDTLLVNSMDSFLPVYLKLLSQALQPYVEGSRMVATLLEATRKMELNRRPDCTLRQVFDAGFYPLLQLERAAVQDRIDRFYLEDFLALESLTQARPEAVAVVDEAFRRDYRVAVTTNPLFPRAAILQRLKWAGLPVEKFPFELVTSYETFHFSKPHPEYFAEVLARLGWPDGPVVVVGDDLDNDIAAARGLGLATYWLEQPGAARPPEGEPPTTSGSLEGLLPWIDRTPPEDLLPDYNLPSAMLAIMRATPAALHHLVTGLPPEELSRRSLPDEWSPTEILCHLRDVEREVNLPRVHTVLQEENPFLAGKDTDPWAEERGYRLQNGLKALQNFTAARLELLELLERLEPSDWQRLARHAILGPTRLVELIGIIAAHDRLHVQQMAAAIPAPPAS